MRALALRRLLIALSAVALFVATAACTAHSHEAKGKSRAPAQCDFCLQMNGFVSAPKSPTASPLIAATPFSPVLAAGIDPLLKAHSRSHRSRAPPRPE